MPRPIYPRVKASASDYLVDAGPLVGAFWPADQWHSRSRETHSALGDPAHTTETVFAEAAHLLERHPLPSFLISSRWKSDW